MFRESLANADLAVVRVPFHTFDDESLTPI